jgi:hypothetical protein
VKNIKTTEKQVGTQIQSWIRRAEKEQSPKVDYYSELSNWLQYTMTEAEKNRSFNKKDQLLTLQKDL